VVLYGFLCYFLISKYERGHFQVEETSPGTTPDAGVLLNRILVAFQPDLKRIEAVLDGHFASHIPFVNEVCGYIVFAGGKRIRPLLTVYAARLCGRRDGAVYDLSVVPEYLHAASLLHDDVVDGGQLRRGKTPAYRIWGNKAVVLVGDYLYARAIDLASSFGEVLIARAIARTVALMAEGEIIQLLQATAPNFDEETYFQVIDRKTAALISASCEIGALLAGASGHRVRAVAEYGRAVGRAFQMVDDILDYTADAGEFGKAVGTDLAEGKITLPVVVALRESGDSDRTRLLEILEAGECSGAALEWVRGLLHRTGAIEYTRERAGALVDAACETLGVFEPSVTRQTLEGLAQYVLQRRK